MKEEAESIQKRADLYDYHCKFGLQKTQNDYPVDCTVIFSELSLSSSSNELLLLCLCFFLL